MLGVESITKPVPPTTVPTEAAKPAGKSHLFLAMTFVFVSIGGGLRVSRGVKRRN